MSILTDEESRALGALAGYREGDQGRQLLALGLRCGNPECEGTGHEYDGDCLMVLPFGELIDRLVERPDRALRHVVQTRWRQFHDSPEWRRSPYFHLFLEVLRSEIGVDADRVGRCRGCGAVGIDFTVADDQLWVQDEDDIGYPYCPACIATLV